MSSVHVLPTEQDIAELELAVVTSFFLSNNIFLFVIPFILHFLLL